MRERFKRGCRYFKAAPTAAILFTAAALCFAAEHFLSLPEAAGHALFACAMLLLFALAASIARSFISPCLLMRDLLEDSQSERSVLRELGERERDCSLIHLVIGLLNSMNQRQQKDYSLEILKKQSELLALQSQINPHFLYNTLDSIRGQLMGTNMTDSADMLEALSNLFRYSINQKAVYNTLEQELENVGNYMNIITLRFEQRIRFQALVDDDCDYIYNCEMPKLTLQPVVENAVQHGLESKKGGGLITLRAFVSERGLHIQISDNGSGIAPEELDRLNEKFRTDSSVLDARKKGIALENINKRIRILYGESYGLHINSDVGIGTEVHILLPVRIVPPEQE